MTTNLNIVGKFSIWNEERRQGLGHDFLLPVDAGLRFIEHNPLMFPEIYREVRRHLIKRFPYKILYRVEDRKVVIFAVVYGGRNPEWITKRLRGI